MKRHRFVCLLLLSAALFGQSNPVHGINDAPSAPMLSRAPNGAAFGTERAVPRAALLATASQTSGLFFAPPVAYSSGGRVAYSVTTADINRDGKADLLVVNQCGNDSACTTDGTVGVLLGNGDGTFQTAVTYDSGGVAPWSVAVADVNGDGKPDLLVSNECASRSNCSNGTVGVLISNGDGTFQAAVTYGSGGHFAAWLAVADVNGDGKPDLLVTNLYATNSNTVKGSVGVLLGNGDGTFQTSVAYGSGDYYAISVAVGDVNGDGKLDLMVANFCGNSNPCTTGTDGTVGVLLGNGDGTFQTAVLSRSGGYRPLSVAVADVNHDGKLDVLVANACGNDSTCATDSSVGVLLGNGDGTFQPVVTYGSGGLYAFSLALADLDGDGKPDIAVANQSDGTGASTVGVLLGNGDGTFKPAVAYGSSSYSAFAVAVGDVNGDGKPDLLVASFCAGSGDCMHGIVSVLINLSRRMTTTALLSSANPSSFGQPVTFTSTVTPQGAGTGMPTGTVSFLDGATSLGNSTLNGSGVATFQISTLGPSTHSITATYNGDTNFATSTSSALSQVVLGAAARFSASALNFGNQTVGITSATQTVILLNTGDIPLNFTSITMGGLDPGDFKQTNNCGSSLAGQAICVIFITFTPTKTGSRSAAVVFKDNAPSKLQKILLTGLGVLPSVSFFSTSLTFPKQVIYTTSLVKTVELTNVGLGVLNISTIDASGPFHQTNNCGSTVGPGSGCTISVTFHPTTIGTLTGALSVSDNAPASPQMVALSGTGTAVKVSPVAIGFGDQPVNTTSLARTITLSNKSHATVNITSIAITGGDRDDFAETNTCGTSVASGASCFIKVQFTPRGKGSRSSAVSITDDGGGSPQSVGLAGTGT